MKKQYSQYLKKQLIITIESSFPDFKYSTIDSMYKTPDEWVFVNRLQGPLNLFIIFVKHHNGGDKFTMELGWSKYNDFPQLSMRPSFEQPEQVDLSSHDAYVCRIGSLMNGNDPVLKSDKWWLLKNPKLFTIKDPLLKLMAANEPLSDAELESIVQPKVQQVEQAIKDHVLPFFKHIKNNQPMQRKG